MSDIELLKLAAKAAGITLGQPTNTGFAIAIESKPYVATWNPLTDDGDALRLLVKISQQKALRLMLPTRNDEWAVVDDYTSYFEFRVYNESDQCCATRMAIVKAAAEIGKEME